MEPKKKKKNVNFRRLKFLITFENVNLRRSINELRVKVEINIDVCESVAFFSVHQLAAELELVLYDWIPRRKINKARRIFVTERNCAYLYL